MRVEISQAHTDNRRVRNFELTLFDGDKAVRTVEIVGYVRAYGTWEENKESIAAMAAGIVGLLPGTRVEVTFVN